MSEVFLPRCRTLVRFARSTVPDIEAPAPNAWAKYAIIFNKDISRKEKASFGGIIMDPNRNHLAG